ncbi:hypothetical protein A4A49_00668 [Nicotiana attenuata]|uniref:Uncharacterized protein n=1 Tax=Nicotiana attenuata TaxID=49451 RepID=A0A1J6J865_NICAT|nr:hypothetical protein A4A49_00668 [Nicotiana attenuata]
MGYATVGGFYYQDPKTKNFVYMDIDAQLFNIVCNLENGDKIHLYIQHIVLDPELVDNVAPTGLIGGPKIGVTEVNGASGEINIEDVSVENEVREDVAAETEVREDVAAETEVREDVAAETEVREDVVADLNGVEREEVVEGEVTDLDGAISNLESSSDSDFDVVPEEDDSDTDEELIVVRNEKRTKLKARRRKILIVHVEVPLGEGKIDRGTRRRGVESAPPSDGQKRSRNVGFGCYTNLTIGMTIINPGSSGERVVSYGTKVVKDISAVNINLGFKPAGLKFKDRNAITTSQLQQLSANRRNQIGSSATTSSVASPAPPAP